MGRSIKLSSKGYAAGWPPELLLAVRFSIAAILFWTFMPLSGGWRVGKKTLFQLAGMGIAGYALMALLLFFAYRYISVGAAVTVFYTYRYGSASCTRVNLASRRAFFNTPRPPSPSSGSLSCS